MHLDFYGDSTFRQYQNIVDNYVYNVQVIWTRELRVIGLTEPKA